MSEKVMNRWLVVVGAILIQLALGAIYAWSVFTPGLKDAGWSKTETQIVFSVGLAMFAIVMVLAGRKLADWGPQRLALAGGITLGVGYFLAGFDGGTKGFKFNGGPGGCGPVTRRLQDEFFGLFNGNGRGAANDDSHPMWMARYQWGFLGRQRAPNRRDDACQLLLDFLEVHFDLRFGLTFLDHGFQPGGSLLQFVRSQGGEPPHQGQQSGESAADEAEHLGHFLHEVPGLVIHLHLYEHVSGEEFSLAAPLASLFHLDHLFGRDEDLSELVLQAHALDALFQGMLHLVFEIRIGVNDVPP